MENSNNIYEQKFHIYSYLVDSDLSLTLPHLMCLLQEVAWAHSNKVNVGWDFLQSQNMFWALTKFYLKIHRFPKWEETISIRTWAKAVQLIIHPRDFEVLDEQGNVLIAATSEWVILDKTDFRPQRNVFDNESKMIEQREAVEGRIPKIPKVHLAENVTFQPVVYSDIDMNQHVNNTRYLMWAINHYPVDFLSTHEVSECCIHFIAQAKIGMLYGIQPQEIDHNQWVSSIVSSQELLELCRIQLNWREKQLMKI